MDMIWLIAWPKCIEWPDLYTWDIRMDIIGLKWLTDIFRLDMTYLLDWDIWRYDLIAGLRYSDMTGHIWLIEIYGQETFDRIDRNVWTQYDWHKGQGVMNIRTWQDLQEWHKDKEHDTMCMSFIMYYAWLLLCGNIYDMDFIHWAVAHPSP